ncbi:MAG TPA: HAMP domain-containing sensor histidine kinase [Bacillota bacterium]|nr:HAMP domain-containing sensor histidine kinase [Bacillota bacterium]HPE38210.1 HAMP domain-containing sensor histidine kinase [Bacillota bacterium]
MKYLRNRELLITLLIGLLISALATAEAFHINFSAGLLSLGTCVVFLSLYCGMTIYRYWKIEKMAMSIDSVLHNTEKIDFDQYVEGELAVLASEVTKLTVRMREQEHQLKTERCYLMDSLADVSHQLRTPLTAMNLLVPLLQKPDLTEEQRLELLHEMRMLLARIEWLVEVLLKISRLDADAVIFDKKDYAIDELVKRALEPIAIPMDVKNQSYTLHIEDGSTMLCDLTWMVEAVGNILKNCMEHTPKGGHIDIIGRKTPIFSEIVIQDSGEGIAKEDLPYLFERFYKGKNSKSSSIGIGLALARMIVNKQNGTIKVENNREPKTGAIFTIRVY